MGTTGCRVLEETHDWDAAMAYSLASLQINKNSTKQYCRWWITIFQAYKAHCTKSEAGEEGTIITYNAIVKIILQPMIVLLVCRAGSVRTRIKIRARQGPVCTGSSYSTRRVGGAVCEVIKRGSSADGRKWPDIYWV